MKKLIKIRDIHLFEQEVLQEYFRKMAQEGWMIQKVKRMWFVFEPCEPQDVSFFFDVYDNGNLLDPNDVQEEQIAYSDFIEEYDYELVYRTSNYQLYKRMDSPQIPIHTIHDAASRKKHQRTIIRYEVYNFLLIALLFTLNFYFIYNISIFSLTNNLSLLLMPLLFLFIIDTWSNCIPFFIWLWKKEVYHIRVKTYELRESLHAFFHFFILLFALLALSFCSGQRMLIYVCSLLLICSCCYFISNHILRRWLKKSHTIVAMIFSCLISLSIVSRFMLSSTLYTIAQETTSSDAYIQESFLLRWEMPMNEDYSIYTNKTEFGRDYVMDILLHDHHAYAFLTTYRGWDVYQDQNYYLFVWDDTILEVSAGPHSDMDQVKLNTLLDQLMK